MKYMSSLEIRNMWLEFFKEKGHEVIDSAPLVPLNDPSLLWINAGVAPLKKLFDGTITPNNPKIANVQKCIRTNDIENVGLTARHHTFFEMLGNFSIGDYFKKEAIEFGFELLTDKRWFNFPLDKLYITYYPTDIDTKNIWLSLGVKESHIIPNEGNYWEIGEGPSGPNTEIFYDRGPLYDDRGIELIEQDLDNDRYIELWNIVFSQFNAKPGTPRSEYEPLPNKNIDTGAGLERFACVLQNVETNFETDLFMPIIKHVEELSGIKYEGQMSFKVIADHIRTISLAISDGAILSNEGRGYVLRRLLRRAVKYGKDLNLTKPFLFELVDTVVKMMSSIYPNLTDTSNIIKTIVKREEESFFETLIEGERRIKDIIKKSSYINGSDAFLLYDTYGFPIELTIEYANEHNIEVDVEGFKEELEQQKIRSRASRDNASSMKEQDEEFLNFVETSKFIGYDNYESISKVIAIFDDGIVFDKTPFYATSGGQVHDIGHINEYEVIDVYKMPHEQHIHIIDKNHNLKVGDEARLLVDAENRELIMKNHTATHLLHQALKDVLGTHVVQQGSQVSKDNLRFDFNHFNNLKDEEILKIEKIVNDHIQNKEEVSIKEMSLDEAKALGAMALFGEKYGDKVRVVDIDWSIELCGGTHVKNTKEIENFAISSIESIGSGIYRVIAFTGLDIEKKLKETLNPLINEIKIFNEKLVSFNEEPHQLPKLISSYKDILNYREFLHKLKEDVRNKEKINHDNLESLIIKDVLSNITDNKKQIIKLSIDNSVLKQVADAIYDKINVEVVFIINTFEDRVSFLCKTDGSVNAGDLIKLAAKVSDGRGGGRPNMAQGGTQNLSKVNDVIEEIKKVLWKNI